MVWTSYRSGWCFQQLPWPQSSSSVLVLTHVLLLWLMMPQHQAGVNVRCCTRVISGDSSAEKELKEELARNWLLPEKRAWGGVSVHERPFWQSLAAVVRGSLLESLLCCFGSKSSHYPVVVDGFLSNSQESAGQQIPWLPGTSHQLEPPSAFCSPDFCADMNLLKMAIQRSILCVKCECKIKGSLWSWYTKSLIPHYCELL